MNSTVLDRLAQIDCSRLRIAETTSHGTVYDFGVSTTGSLSAGILLAEACLGGLGTVELTHCQVGNTTWPAIQISTDSPLEACLFSQYAGWRISVDKYFAMGSGPMRAVAAREGLFEKLSYQEESSSVLGVLETGQLPPREVIDYVADRCGVNAENVTLLVAPTSSLAGTMQVVARSVETAMHKLFELGFDVAGVKHGFGVAPIPPVAADDLTGIGLTNDAILYAGEVTLWVDCEDDAIAQIGPQVPSTAADCHGAPFLEIFKAADHDFYKVDPMLFSPAKVTFQNLNTGQVHQYGSTAPVVLAKSFGL